MYRRHRQSRIRLHKKRTVLEDLVFKDKFPEGASSESSNPENGSMAGLSGKCNCRVDSDIDVPEDDGLIIIADSMVSDLNCLHYSVPIKLY